MWVTLAIVAVAFLGACQLGSHAYTLYRSSAANPGARLHVATFDAAEGDEYNQGNCRIATDLFAKQPGVTVRYWCEKGGFRD